MPKKKQGRKKITPKTTKKTAMKPAVKETITKFYDKSSVYTTQFVKDFTKAKKFYSEKLEFPINLEIPEAGWMELKLPVKGAFLGLSLHRKDQGEFVIANSLNISIKDIGKTKSLLESRGIKTSKIVDMPDMISMITIDDPDKNKIHFIAPPRVKSKK